MALDGGQESLCPLATASFSDVEAPSSQNGFFSRNATYPARPSVHDGPAAFERLLRERRRTKGSCSVRPVSAPLPSL